MIVGIDYSITNPCLCIYNPLLDKKIKFFYLTSKKKQIFFCDPFYGYEYPIYKNNLERFDKISNYIVSFIIDNAKNSKIFLEGYSFGSKGLQYNIGENCGLLKYKLWKKNYNINMLSPSEIKKFATGRGNANKKLMYEHFIKDTNLDLESFGFIPTKNPASDIVDSYYIAKLGWNKLFNPNKPY